MSRRIYNVMRNEQLEDLIIVSIHTCGCTSQYSELMFYEDEEDEWDSFYDYIYANYGAMELSDYIKYETKDNILYLYRNKNTMCTKCKTKEFKESIRYCDESPRPVGFENVTIYRGLNAYYGEGTYEDIVKLFNRLIDKPELQICCSTNTIGDIGVILEGEVIMASNIDLNTAKDKKTGRRFYRSDSKKEEHIIYDAKDLKKNEYNMNDEIVMQNVKIKAIWLDLNATEESEKAAFDLANKHNLEIIDVNSEF